MTRTSVSLIALLLVMAWSASAALAAIPDPALSVCQIEVIQVPPTPPCLAAAATPVSRLCPAGDYDRVLFHLRVLDSTGSPCGGVLITLFETPHTPSVNMVEVNDPPTSTDVDGRATIGVRASSGFGYIGVCADGIALDCRVEVHSPDVGRGPLPPQCELPTTVESFVNANDILNPVCGFIANFGPVGLANRWWDLNCNGFVNASDVLGYGFPPMGGVIQHYFDGGFLGERDTCP